MIALLSPFFWVLAALCNAVMDSIADKPHYDQSIFSKYSSDFWLKTDSWDNKYKDIDGDGEGDVEGGFRFTGIFEPLNNFLDAWHIFQMLMIIFLAASVMFFQYTVVLFIFDGQFWNIIMWFGILGILWNGPFNLAYNKYLKKKIKIN